MPGWIARRAAVVRAILSKPWRIAIGIFGVVATWDTLLSQFVPDDLAKQAPKAWQVAVLTGGLIPTWAWVVVLAVTFAAACLEYAIRRADGRGQVLVNPLPSPALEETRPPATTPQSAVDISQRARISIRNVQIPWHYGSGDQLPVDYDIVNSGRLPATGLVHRVWCDVLNEETRRPPLSPNPEWQWQIVEPAETLTRTRELRSGLDQPSRQAYEPPLISDEEYEHVAYSDMHGSLVGIVVCYWDGCHTKRLTEIHYRHNPDGGTWDRVYYREDVAIS